MTLAESRIFPVDSHKDATPIATTGDPAPPFGHYPRVTDGCHAKHFSDVDD